MAKGSEKGGGIVLPVLLSVVTAAAISVGGFGAGFGVGRVVYGTADQPVQSPPAADNQQSAGASAAGIARGPNVQEDYGTIIWLSTTWPSNPASVLDQQPAAPAVTQPATSQPEAAPSAPAQTPVEPAPNTGGSEQTSGPAQSPNTSDKVNSNGAATLPSVNETTSGNQSSGNGNNFNTYNNQNQQQTSAQWVLNTSTKKIHYPNCRDVPKIAPQNYATSNLSEGKLLNQGYTTCGHCH